MPPGPVADSPAVSLAGLRATAVTRADQLERYDAVSILQSAGLPRGEPDQDHADRVNQAGRESDPRVLAAEQIEQETSAQHHDPGDDPAGIERHPRPGRPDAGRK